MCGDVPRGGETCREFGVGTSVTLGLKIADVGENNLRRVGRGHGRNEELGMKSVDKKTQWKRKPLTCEASRNHEVPWFIHAEPSRAFINNKAVDFRA